MSNLVTFPILGEILIKHEKEAHTQNSLPFGESLCLYRSAALAPLILELLLRLTAHLRDGMNSS